MSTGKHHSSNINLWEGELARKPLRSKDQIRLIKAIAGSPAQRRKLFQKNKKVTQFEDFVRLCAIRLSEISGGYNHGNTEQARGQQLGTRSNSVNSEAVVVEQASIPQQETPGSNISNGAIVTEQARTPQQNAPRNIVSDGAVVAEQVRNRQQDTRRNIISDKTIVTEPAIPPTENRELEQQAETFRQACEDVSHESTPERPIHPEAVAKRKRRPSAKARMDAKMASMRQRRRMNQARRKDLTVVGD